MTVINKALGNTTSIESTIVTVERNLAGQGRNLGQLKLIYEKITTQDKKNVDEPTVTVERAYFGTMTVEIADVAERSYSIADPTTGEVSEIEGWKIIAGIKAIGDATYSENS